MRLRLINGYPYPYPKGLTQEQEDDVNEAALSRTLEIEGVVHFEWLHTVTVEFDSWGSYNSATNLTGWKAWSFLVLEAQTSSGDGYNHPAIVVGNTAYCGFILES